MSDVIDEVVDWNFNAANGSCGDVFVDLIEALILKVIEKFSNFK